MSMSPPPPPASTDALALVADLDAAERGFVLGRLVTLGLEAGAPAAPLAEPAGARCARALARIAQLERPLRLDLMKRLAHDVVSAHPTATEQIPPGTLARALAGESTDTLRVLTEAAAGSVPPAIREAALAVVAGRAAEESAPGAVPPDPSSRFSEVAAETIAELLRSVLASIAPVTGRIDAGNASPLAERLSRGTAAELLDALAGAGADLLGTSLQGAEATVVARAVEEIGAPWADRVRGAAGPAPESSWPTVSRERARRLVAATGRASTPLGTLQRLGAVALGVLLATDEPELIEAVAVRLPDDLGQRLRAAAGA